MVSDRKVRRLIDLANRKGLPVAKAAAKAGMSEPTARKYLRLRKLPSEVKKPHTWRTREDPFESVRNEIKAALEANPCLEAKAFFLELSRRHPGKFQSGQLRTLQRRFRKWRENQGF